ncbi:tail fiber assembly protein [Pseudomonas sp. UBA4194]|uniref:tail fiber assembly protein n=1 Tax=Pseudomonas sp. UBA4194 TaxID=1947317 RepID=UPI0025F042F1|nr:tail fiber assembly protein [Pseudomonas sp. UBA4194]
MTNYAVTNASTGKITNIIVWNGDGQWVAPEGAIVVQAPDDAMIGGSYTDGEFLPPPVPATPLPTPQEILATNSGVYAQLYAQASQAMTPLLLSLQLGDADDEETQQAKAWQAYCRQLKAIDLTTAKPEWPELPI